MRGDVFYCRTAMDGVNMMNVLRSGNDLGEVLEQNKRKLQRRLERAEAKAAEEEQLLATLPRRVVSFEGHALPETPRFARKRIEYTLEEFLPHLDKKTLFSLNWRFGGHASRERAGHTEAQLDKLFDEWIARASKHGYVKPQGVIGIYPCQADGDEVIVYDPEDLAKVLLRLDFTVVLGAEREDIVSAAQYFRPKASSLYDAIGLQITTSGHQVDQFLAEIKASGDSESTLFLQGLSDRIAEDMAEHLHNEQRKLLGLPASQGQRWSPGYPGMRNITLNAALHHQLDAQTLCGITLTDANEFSPTGTTAAVVSYHKDARYT